MPDDFVDTEAAPVTATEREFDNTLSRAFDAWNGTGQAETPKGEPEETPEPETKPKKPARKLSRAERELDEKPDFGGEDEAEEQDEPAKARKADKSKAKAEPEKNAEEEDDLESLQPPENARANTKADWHALKGKAKEYKGRVKALESEIAQLRAGKDSLPKKSVDDLTAEIDGLKPPKNPHQVDGFTRLKEASKERTALLKSEVQQEREARELAEAELTDWREGRGKLPPAEFQKRIQELEKEVETLRPSDIKRRVSEHPQFVQACITPVQTTFDNIINKCVEWGGNTPEFQQWAQAMREQVGADGFDAAGWQDAVLNKFDKDPVLKQQMTNEVAQLLSLRQRRDAVRENLAKDHSAFDRFAKESLKQRWDSWGKGALEAQPELVKEFSHWTELKTEDSTELFKKEILPRFNHYLGMVADDTLPPQLIGKNQAIVAGKLAAFEEKNARLEKELASARRETELFRRQATKLSQVRSIPAKAGGVLGKRKAEPVDIFSDRPNFDLDSDD
jgi:hypothetical protein